MNSLAGRDEGRKPLSLVQQGTDTILHIDLVSTLSGDAFDPAQLTQLSATIQNDSRTASALIPVTIQDGALSIELTADLSRRLGTGYYTLTITGRAADSAYADGFRDYTIPLSLCRVTRSPAPSVPDKLTATVRDGLRGKDGKSAYEIAVKHGYTSTEDEWAKSLVGNDGADAYEVAKKAGYTGSREEWLKTLIGATGLSAYELAKAEGYEGSLSEWLTSLKGADGEDAYEVAKAGGYQGSREAWLESLKGETGKSAYELAKAGGYQGSQTDWLASLKGKDGKNAYELAKEAQSFTGSLTEYLASLKGVNGKSAYQSYLDTTTDNPKLTEAQWATINAVTTQFLYRINKGKEAPMNEQTLSADQLLELQGNLIELANAMSKFGVVIDSRDVSIRSIIEDVKRSDIDLRLIVHRNDQFTGYPGERLPPLVLNGSISCDRLFKNSGIVELPAIGDIELTTSIVEFIYGAPAIRRVSLPTLKFARDAWFMAGGCASLEEVRIGDLPECAGLDDALSRNPKLRSVEIGNCPKVDRMVGFASYCPALEIIRIELGDKLLRFNEAFNGCSSLRTIEGTLNVSLVAQISNGTFGGCTSLAEVRIKGLKTSINLADCQRLSLESIRYLVENAQTVTGQSIDLSRTLLETHEEELGELGDTASDKGFTFNYR